MRIAILHSRYLSGAASGENRAVEDDIRLLTEAGHEVRSWMPEPASDTPAARAMAGVGSIWSAAAAARVRSLVADWGAEVVHFHNLFPCLSPAAIRAAAGGGAGVAMTLHNYRLMCLPASLLRAGRPCEDCVGRAPWRGVAHRCYRGSTLASAALATTLTTHRGLGTFERVGTFLAVSEFVRAKHIDAGFAADRLLLAPQFAWPTRPREGPGEYFLYLGRLMANKGAATLMDAWAGRSERLLVVGDGPQMEQLRAIAPPPVELRGLAPAAAVPELLRGARALLVPSLVYDAAPRVIAEAYAAGVPVLASRIGGLPEVVRDGESGLLIAPGDPDAWAAAVTRLSDGEESLRLGAGALRLWEQRHRPEQSLQRLESVYRALAPNGRTTPL